MIFWRQPDPGRELPTRSEHFGGGRFMLSIAAPIGPTPGIRARRRLHGSVLCQAISLASTSSICACNWGYFAA